MASRSSKKKKPGKDDLPTQWSNWEWIEEKSCWSSYRLNEYGVYEYQYSDNSAQQSTATLNNQGYKSSNTPRYAPSPDTPYEGSAYGTSPGIPGYTTIDDTIAGFGNMTLKKGKDREAEYLASVSSSNSVPSSFAPVDHTDSSYAAGGPQYTQNPGESPYQQSPYPYAGQYVPTSDSSSSQQPIYSSATDQTSFAEQAKNHTGPEMSGWESRLNSRFKVHHGSEFKLGRVFKILWAEPTGINGTQISDSEQPPGQSRSHKYGEEFIHKIRRFVVVNTFPAQCVCLPIQTYGRQGARMAGAQAHHHAIIYSDRQVEYKGENLTKRAIRVEMTTSKEKLDEASRINYAKAYTIEYNVKVLFIGRVHHKHRHQLLADYQNSMGLYSDPPGPGPSYQQESPPNLVDTIEQISKSPISPGLSAAESVEFPYEASVSLVPPSKLDSAVVIKRPGLSRRSSVDTIESLFSNALSVSSTSTVGALKGGAQRLAEFLSAQDSLQTLLKEALQKVSLDDLEDNLRRSLIQFSAHLKAEATLPVMVEAASAVRRLARNAASLFRQSLEHEAKVTGDEGAAASDFTEHESQDQDDGDDDDDDLLEEKEGEDPMDLEVLLSKSVALRLLEENLRLFIYPNPVKRALFKIWPIAHPRNLSLTIKHDLEWEVPTFLEKYFPKGQQLGKVLTITGHAFNAQAQSCANYLLQTWPDISLILLAGLHELLSPGADALSWISASVRHSPSDDPVYSYAAVSGIKSSRPIQNLTIRMKEFEEIQIDRPCWHPLIPHAVIAKGFPIRHRKAGKGLDISFADMALLSQSMSFTEYDEGLIVEGLRSVLIPMEFLHQDDAIQWHLEYKRQKKAPKKRSISQIFATAPVPEWYKSQEPDELFHKRCFLGWTEEVSVMIGTLEFSGPRVYRSDAGPPPRTRRVKSHNISMGASCLGIVGANGSKTWEEASMPSSVTLEIHKDIHDTLADDSNATVLIYDPGEKTAWLLPQPSVVLYLTHKILAKRKYQLFDGDRETEFKFAEPGRDGAREASYILHEIIDFKVQKSSKFREDLSKTVKQICYQLDVLGDRLALATSEFERIGGGEGNNLYGFELNEMLGMTTSINIKQVRIEQPWTHVVRKRGIVLFCAGFGQAIVPATRSLEKLCATYQRVPPNRNLLATTGAVLHAFLEPLDQGPPGCTLGRRVEWLQDKFLLQSHTHGQRTSVFHEQSLQIVENSAPDPSMLGSLGCYLSSGFIFTGHRSRVACSEVMISPTSTSPSWAPENVLDEAKPDSNLTQEDSGSDISHETDSGFNSGNMATSSLIGDELPPTEKELDQVIQPLATATTSSTWGTKDSQPDSAYVIGPFPSRETSMASSSSNTPRTVKNNDGCVDLATVVDKGKKPTSETEGSVWKLGGSSFKRMAQKAFAKPTELSGSDAETLSKEIKNIDLGSGKAKRRRH